MKDKNIGLITILHVNNYGAELQAFALQHKLNDFGYTAEIINYLYYKNPKHKATARSQPFIKLTPVQKLKEFLYPYIAQFKSIPFYKQKKKGIKSLLIFMPNSPKYRRLILVWMICIMPNFPIIFSW